MTFERAFEVLASDSHPGSFERFQRRIPAEWVTQALAATGTATLRRRRLPAEQVIWVVIGMALYRGKSIEEVVSKLDLSLPGAGPIARSSIPQARSRVGAEPLRWLFQETAKQWAHRSADADRWRGLAMYGIDGTVLRVADSVENRSQFGGQINHRSKSGYPLVRVVALLALRSHLVSDAVVRGYENSDEHHCGLELRASIPDHSLTIVDRNFHGATLLLELERTGRERHWLRRARSSNRWVVVQQLGPGDALVEMTVSDRSRAEDPTLPKKWRLRAIEVTRGNVTQTLLTSLKDPVKYPAQEVAQLYRERWEIELAYDELKTNMLDRQETIRSKIPAHVEQEIWGLLLAFNLVRLEMVAVAQKAKVAPNRISFVISLNLIRDEWLWCAIANPGAIPKHLVNLRESLQRYILPPRRSHRSYPRAVKQTSPYPRRRPAALN